ncbi:MAG: hypothetical protein ACI9JM_003089 [Halioglobus sp.]|jgi:hypothetical protein
MKIWLVIALLTLPVLSWPAVGEETGETIITETVEGEEVAPQHDDDDPINWVDTSHAYATDSAQALTEWMDEFFGDPSYELDQAESHMRLQWRNSWDQDDGYKTKLRLRGKLQLPKVSKRLNLVFFGESSEDIVTDENSQEGRAGLLYNVNERSRSRLDLTLTGGTGSIRPGARYRNKGPLGENYYYRYTQRLEWDNDDGLHTTGQLNFDRALSDTRLVRLSNRIIYGEETLGTEWRSTLSHSHRQRAVHNGDRVLSYFASVEGYTDPSWIENYQAGLVYRRQIYRKFLYMEIQPSYLFRKRLDDDNRNGAWNVLLRFEIALHRDLRRVTSSSQRVSPLSSRPVASSGQRFHSPPTP